MQIVCHESLAGEAAINSIVGAEIGGNDQLRFRPEKAKEKYADGQSKDTHGANIPYPPFHERSVATGPAAGKRSSLTPIKIGVDRQGRARDTRDMLVFAFFALGLMVGSFLNVLADRLPNGDNVLWGRSRCDWCKKTLRWFELFPLISFLAQKGRCARCHKRISFQYPLVELAAGLGFAGLSVVVPSAPLPLTAAIVIFCSFLVIFVADAKYQIIPDSMVVAAAIGSLIWVSLTAGDQLLSHVASGIGCALFFYAIWIVTRGRGMGMGDVKLSAILGFFLGFPPVLFALYAAFLTGAGAGVILMMAGHKTLKSKIAFGPFLLLGAAIAIFFNQALLRLWKLIV